jgi:prostaglandin-H2 D-isomerase / glutathione transferase
LEKILFNEFSTFTELAAVEWEEDQEIQAKKRVPLEAETIPFYVEKLESLAKENNGHFANGKVKNLLRDFFQQIYSNVIPSQLTWVDFYFTGVLDYLNYMLKRDVTADNPFLKKVTESVMSIESIKKWVEKRPDNYL